MLEKSSRITLTPDDLDKASNGVVSERVKNTWNFTLEELRAIIESNDYTAY